MYVVAVVGCWWLVVFAKQELVAGSPVVHSLASCCSRGWAFIAGYAINVIRSLLQ